MPPDYKRMISGCEEMLYEHETTPELYEALKTLHRCLIEAHDLKTPPTPARAAFVRKIDDIFLAAFEDVAAAAFAILLGAHEGARELLAEEYEHTDAGGAAIARYAPACRRLEKACLLSARRDPPREAR